MAAAEGGGGGDLQDCGEELDVAEGDGEAGGFGGGEAGLNVPDGGQHAIRKSGVDFWGRRGALRERGFLGLGCEFDGLGSRVGFQDDLFRSAQKQNGDSAAKGKDGARRGRKGRV